MKVGVLFQNDKFSDFSSVWISKLLDWLWNPWRGDPLVSMNPRDSIHFPPQPLKFYMSPLKKVRENTQKTDMTLENPTMNEDVSPNKEGWCSIVVLVFMGASTTGK